MSLAYSFNNMLAKLVLDQANLGFCAKITGSGPTTGGQGAYACAGSKGGGVG